MINPSGMNGTPKGTLIIIGGHEDREGDMEILKEVGKRASGKGHLALITVATNKPEAVAKEYTSIFKKLGVQGIRVVDVRTRDEAHDPEKVKVCEKASVIFFTGGDQLRISSQIGDSPIFRCMRDVYLDGGTIVGTSAGAAAMSETMIIDGESDASGDLEDVDMAPGLGFLAGTIVDSHFAERGRIGRLLGSVAKNPKNLGLGIDENTAIVVKPDGIFEVLGEGAVYVVDGIRCSYSNLSDANREGILTAFDLKLHVLGAEYRYDLNQRRPILDGKIAPEISDKEQAHA
jgi:cyanophycinase